MGFIKRQYLLQVGHSNLEGGLPLGQESLWQETEVAIKSNQELNEERQRELWEA